MKMLARTEIKELFSIRTIDAEGRVFYPESIDDIAIFSYEERDFYILGSGTNVIAGKLSKPVLYVPFLPRFINPEDEDEEFVYLNVSASVRNNELIAFCKEAGLSGVEFLAGIPGTVGGAVVGNAAPRGDGWEGIVERAIGIHNGTPLEVKLNFHYRGTSGYPSGTVFFGFTFRLRKSSTREVTDRVSRYLERRIRIPFPTAGSLFKNPGGKHTAGELLDMAGLKGFSVNDAALWEGHANIVVNKGGARFSDFCKLRDLAREKVFKEFGIDLEPEVKFWGEEC